MRAIAIVWGYWPVNSTWRIWTVCTKFCWDFYRQINEYAELQRSNCKSHSRREVKGREISEILDVQLSTRPRTCPAVACMCCVAVSWSAASLGVAIQNYQGGDTRIPLTRWSVGHVWQDKHQSGIFFVFIRQYARICLYMKRHDLGQNPNELLVTSLACKVGLFYSSVSNTQLLNTKNSFLQLFSRKATLKYEVLFKSVFFTNFFTWNCSKKC